MYGLKNLIVLPLAHIVQSIQNQGYIEPAITPVSRRPINVLNSDAGCYLAAVSFWLSNNHLCRYPQGPVELFDGASAISFDAEYWMPQSRFNRDQLRLGAMYRCRVAQPFYPCSRAFMQAGMMDYFYMTCSSADEEVHVETLEGSVDRKAFCRPRTLNDEMGHLTITQEHNQITAVAGSSMNCVDVVRSE